MTRKLTIRDFYPAEIVTFIYGLFTVVLILFLYGSLHKPFGLIVERVAFMGVIVALAQVSKVRDTKWVDFGRYVTVLLLLPYWYSDTFEFNRIFTNLDHLFAVWEQTLFGCQPAFRFGEIIPQTWFSELINFGYFFLYPMIALFSILIFRKQPRRFDKWIFVLMTTFFFYYLLFIAIPVAGPQFYFPAIGWDVAREGVFPPIGSYFDTHPGMIPNEPIKGLFSWIVHQTHLLGERPTGAFPSSHVGMSTVVMIAAWRYSKPYFWSVAPIYLFLVMATVYIKAHYLIDSIAGFVTAFLFYACAERLYKMLPHPHTEFFN